MASLQKKASRAVAKKIKVPAKKNRKKYIFKLYVTGPTPRSTRAIANLKKLCDQHLPGRYELEVIDIYQQPDKARTEQIIAAPTLVKHFPAPLSRYIGDLSDPERLLANLQITEAETD
jgi:circadian clock protein KaiB